MTVPNARRASAAIRNAGLTVSSCRSAGIGRDIDVILFPVGPEDDSEAVVKVLEDLGYVEVTIRRHPEAAMVFITGSLPTAEQMAEAGRAALATAALDAGDAEAFTPSRDEADETPMCGYCGKWPWGFGYCGEMCKQCAADDAREREPIG